MKEILVRERERQREGSNRAFPVPLLWVLLVTITWYERERKKFTVKTPNIATLLAKHNIGELGGTERKKDKTQNNATVLA
jgi:ribosomal protein L11